MTNGFLFKGLSPIQILEGFAAAAGHWRERGHDALQLVVDDDAIGLAFIPNKDPRRLDKAEQKELDLLKRSFKGLAMRPEFVKLPGRLFPLHEGLARLLLYSEDSGVAAEPDPAQNLLIATDIEPEHTAWIYHSLCRRATHTRLASARFDGVQRCFFHVLHDRERGSAFIPPEEDGFFSGCAHLIGYPVQEDRQERLIFLPEYRSADHQGRRRRLRVDVRALEAFGAILIQLPEWFGSSDSSSQLLAAIEGPLGASQQDFRCYLLSALSFTDQAALLSREWSQIDIRVPVQTQPQEAREQLQKLVQSDSRSARRVWLMPIRHRQYDGGRHRQLKRRLIRLQQEIHNLESAQAPRPSLFRFSHHQFPALVRALRYIDKPLLRNGDVLYGFHASEAHPKGLHYLEGAPDAAPEIRRALSHAGLFGETVARYQLDVFWSGYYHDGSRRSHLYVPEGAALYPPIHSWEAEEIDAYIADLIGERRVEGIGSPVYIVDGRTGSEARLEIVVLDHEKMLPPAVRIGWFNDCLTLSESQNLESVIQENAALLTQFQIAEKLRDRSEELIARFERATEQIRAMLLERADTLLFENLAEEMEQFVEDAGARAQKIAELRERLESLAGPEKAMAALVSQSDEAERRLAETGRQLGDRVLKHEKWSEDTMAWAKKKREKIEREVRGAIVTLRNARAHLKKELRRALFPRIFRR